MSAPPQDDFAREFALLEERLAERGLTRDDTRRAEVHVKKNWPPHGAVGVFPYRRADGSWLHRLLLLEHPKGAQRGGWRWPSGTEVRGAVLSLGDPARAEIVIVAEGESDALTAWRYLHDDSRFAILAVPGASMVAPDLANFIGNAARVIVATDSDPAGDKCAERVRQVLVDAGHEPTQVVRFRPIVEGIDRPDLRDVVEALEHAEATAAQIAAWIVDSARPCDGAEPTAAQEVQQDHLGARDNAQPGASSGGVRILADVEERPIRWLAEGMIPMGALTLLVGAGGFGKTTVALHVAARLTRGQPIFPGMPAHEPADVLIASAEDAIAEVLKPRMRLAGADLRRVHVVDLAERDLSLPDDVDWLREQAERVGAKLNIIDPISAFLGVNIDSHRDASLRSALRPVHALAEATGAAVLAIAHTNKGAGGDIGQRVSGSAAWVNACRSALVFAPPPDADDADHRRVIAVAKSNYGPRGTAHELTLRVPAGEEHPVIAYVGPSGLRPSDLLANDRDERRTAIDDADAFVRDFLEDGDWHRSADVKQAALKEQHKRRTVERAAERIGVEIEQRDFPRVTYWRLAQSRGLRALSVGAVSDAIDSRRDCESGAGGATGGTPMNTGISAPPEDPSEAQRRPSPEIGATGVEGIQDGADSIGLSTPDSDEPNADDIERWEASLGEEEDPS